MIQKTLDSKALSAMENCLLHLGASHSYADNAADILRAGNYPWDAGRPLALSDDIASEPIAQALEGHAPACTDKLLLGDDYYPGECCSLSPLSAGTALGGALCCFVFTGSPVFTVQPS